jgi:predicted Fe-Mo cluster-binding NifX family protein
MRIAFPAQEDRGLQSAVFGHFGSAPLFIIVDTESGDFRSHTNADRDHAHGGCLPTKALGGLSVDAVVVGGIGAGALRQLSASGIRTYRAVAGTVLDNLELIKSSNLPALTMDQTCAGHGPGGPCNH